jgi:hypothetical protein
VQGAGRERPKRLRAIASGGTSTHALRLTPWRGGEMAMAGGERCRDGDGFSRPPHSSGGASTRARGATAAGAPVGAAAARERHNVGEAVVESGVEALLATVQGVVGELRVWERHNVVPCQQAAFAQIVQRLSMAAHEAARAQSAVHVRAAPDESANHIPAQTVTQDKMLRPPTSATAALDDELFRLELRERGHEPEPTCARSEKEVVISSSSCPEASTVPAGSAASQSASASEAGFPVPVTMPRERQTSNVFDAPSSASQSRDFVPGQRESAADALSTSDTETELQLEPTGRNSAGDDDDGHASLWKGAANETTSRSSFDATLAAAVSGEWSAAPPGCTFSQEPCTGDSDSDEASNAVMRVVMRPIEQLPEEKTNEGRLDVQQLGTTAGPPDFSSLVPVEHRPPNGQWLRAV